MKKNNTRSAVNYPNI